MLITRSSLLSDIFTRPLSMSEALIHAMISWPDIIWEHLSPFAFCLTIDLCYATHSHLKWFSVAPKEGASYFSSFWLPHFCSWSYFSKATRFWNEGLILQWASNLVIFLNMLLLLPSFSVQLLSLSALNLTTSQHHLFFIQATYLTIGLHYFTYHASNLLMITSLLAPSFSILVYDHIKN